MAEVVQQIEAGVGSAVIDAEAVNAEEAGQLRTLLDAQPKWSDLPLIILAGREELPRWIEPLASRPNSTLLRHPLQESVFVATLVAATQKRLRQYELRDLLGQLEARTRQLQRLALELTETEERERQQLAQVLHDDLQQILVGAIFHVGLLPARVRENSLDQATRELADLLRQAIETSRRISHDLSPPTLQQHGLVAALWVLADQMQQMHGLRVEIEVYADAEPSEAPVKWFLFRAAQEFLLNIVKHAQTDQAHLRLSRTEWGVELRVRDRGRGFSPESIPNPGAPASFGLFSIRERALFMGGRFEAHSSSGEGSTFTLTLPWRSEGAADSISPTAELASPPEPGPELPPDRPHRALRVMLADDHQVMRSGLKALLSGQGGKIEVIAEADNGVEAVALAEQLHPDVILMDVAMPRMDGIEATQRIKTRHPDIRIIGLSMFDDEQTAIKMRSAGAERYLPKTGPGETLVSAVHGESSRLEARPAEKG